MTQLKDFSKPRVDLRFTVDGEEFEAWPALPVEVLLETLATSAEIFANSDRTAIRRIFEIMLKPESAARFGKRLGSMESPIDIQQVDSIIEWLLESYGQRPTGPSESSSDGSSNPGDGTGSTVNLPLGELTHSP